MKEDTTIHSGSSKPKNSVASKLVAGILLVVIVGVGGFFGGISYEKGHTTSSSATAAAGSQERGGFGGGTGSGRRNFSGGSGTVSSISSSSIVITSQQSSTTKTYSITNATQITDNGSSVTYSDIQTGDTVFVMTSGSSSTIATRILVNPSFGGAGGQAQTGGTSDTMQSE